MKKFTIRFVTVFLPIFSIFGCAASVEQPTKREIENQFVVSKSFENTWLDIIDWFAAAGVGLKDIEKESGLINADPGSVDKGDFLDCG